MSSAEKGEHSRAAGADEIINYKTEDLADRVKAITGGAGVDAIIELDFSNNARLVPDCLRSHGTVAIYGMTEDQFSIQGRWMLRNSANLRFFLIYDLSPEDRAAALVELSHMLEEDKLKHAIHARLPLAQIVDAHNLVDSGRAVGGSK